MARTKKDILVLGRSAEEIRGVVQSWFAQNSIGVIDNKANYIKGRWGTGFLTAAKYFQVSFAPAQGGILAQTEGWITVYGVADSDFSPTALGAGIPRREGWKAMERLWSTLQAFSLAAKYCPSCGKGLEDTNVKFCPYCGKQTSQQQPV
jgi:hypothetical protein